MQEIIVKNKKADIKKVELFGFKKCNKRYEYTTSFMNGDFTLLVKISENNKILTELTENETKEIYTLHLTDAEGNFIGQIRDEYNKVIEKIIKECFIYDVFKNNYTKKVISYIKDVYSDELEYLWEKFPDNAIARRKDNSKWYLIIMTVKKNKLGFDSDEKIEVIDIRADKNQIQELTEKPDIYPGYHMNKKNWITIILDGSIKIEEIYKFIDKSYALAKKS